MAKHPIKKKQIRTGSFNLSEGFQNAYAATESQETKRLLTVLEGVYEKAFGHAITAAFKVNSPKVVDDLSKFLRVNYSPAYQRNVRSKLYLALDHSPLVEDFSHISDGWKSVIREHNPSISQESWSLEYWGQYVEAKKIWPLRKSSHPELTEFQKWLASEKNLAKHSSAFNHRATIRDWLRAANLFEENDDPQVVFSKSLEEEFEKISLFGRNVHIPQYLRSGLKKKRHGANTRAISDNTVKKIKYQMNSWIKWIIKNDKPISMDHIESFLDVDFLVDYLEDRRAHNEMTLETAMGCVSIAKTLYRLAVGSKILPETSFGGADTYTEALQDLEQLILDETWAPSRNQKLVEDARAGKFPTLKELHGHLVHKILREKPKWSVALKELKDLEHPDQISSFAESCLQEIRAAVFVSFELMMGPRVGDCVILPKDSLRLLTDNKGKETFYHIGWIPQKTKRRNNSPEVDVCIPSWLTGLISDYLLVTRFIHSTSPVLIPPFEKAQKASSVSPKEESKTKISYSQFEDLVKTWCGRHLANNMMRKIVGKTYKSLGLTDLHQTLGHSKRSREAIMSDSNTEIERDHYMILDDDDRIEIAHRNYSILAKKLEVPGNLDLSFLSKTTREILKNRQLQ